MLREPWQDLSIERGSAVTTGSTTGAGVPVDLRKCLAFGVGSERFAIQIDAIREIIGVEPARQIPEAPHFVRGVFNRGNATILAVSLRQRFGLADIEDTPETCIIVVGLPTPVGLVVDRVDNLFDADYAALGAARRGEATLDPQAIRGSWAVAGEEVTLLALEQIISDAEAAGYLKGARR